MASGSCEGIPVNCVSPPSTEATPSKGCLLRTLGPDSWNGQLKVLELFELVVGNHNLRVQGYEVLSDYVLLGRHSTFHWPLYGVNGATRSVGLVYRRLRSDWSATSHLLNRTKHLRTKLYSGIGISHGLELPN
jgi:hypothetical protein